MGKGALDLFSTEIKGSYRGFKERTQEHPLITGWFIILLITGFWILLMLVEFSKGIEDPPFRLSEGDILFTIFFVIMAKASVETVENTLRNEQLKHHLSSPISVRKVQFSRFLKVYWYNLLLVVISLSIVSILTLIFGFEPPVTQSFYYHLYLLLLIAPLIGFNLGMFTQVKGTFKKISSLMLYGQNISLIWLVLHSDFPAKYVSLYITALGSLSIIFLCCSEGLFWEVWRHGTNVSTNQRLRFHRAGDFLPEWIRSPVRRIAEKEILIRWRRRESPATIAVTGMIGAGLIFFYMELGSSPDLGLGIGKYVYPILIGMSIYIAVILQIVFPSLSLFGREGKTFWAIRSLPVASKDIVWGKVMAILIYSPVIILIVALPLPLLLPLPLEFILFSVFSSILMIFLLGGIGAWAAAKFPNFDESVNGAPDVTTMYTMMITGMISAFLFLAIPVVIFRVDRVLGLLALIFMTDMSALVLLFLLKRAGKVYEGIEMDF